jgi:hypothetical protein
MSTKAQLPVQEKPMASEPHIAQITFPDGNVVAARRSQSHPGSYEVISFVPQHEPLIAFTGTRSLVLSAIELARRQLQAEIASPLVSRAVH